MKLFIIRLSIIFGGMLGAGYFMPGIEVENYEAALYATLFLSFLNATLRPIILFLTFPVTLLTLGISSVLISGFIVYIVGVMIEGIHIENYWWALALSVTVSFLTAIANEFDYETDDDDEDQG